MTNIEFLQARLKSMEKEMGRLQKENDEKNRLLEYYEAIYQHRPMPKPRPAMPTKYPLCDEPISNHAQR